MAPIPRSPDSSRRSLAALFVRWKWRSSVGILVWLLAFGVTAAGDLWEVVTAPKWLAGLVRVSPFVVFAVLPLCRRLAGREPAGRGERVERWLPVVFGLTALIYLLIAFAGVDTSGGKSLGPRLLLPLHPLLSVVGRRGYRLVSAARPQSSTAPWDG